MFIKYGNTVRFNYERKVKMYLRIGKEYINITDILNIIINWDIRKIENIYFDCVNGIRYEINLNTDIDYTLDELYMIFYEILYNDELYVRLECIFEMENWNDDD